MTELSGKDEQPIKYNDDRMHFSKYISHEYAESVKTRTCDDINNVTCEECLEEAVSDGII